MRKWRRIVERPQCHEGLASLRFRKIGSKCTAKRCCHQRINTEHFVACCNRIHNHQDLHEVCRLRWQGHREEIDDFFPIFENGRDCLCNKHPMRKYAKPSIICSIRRGLIRTSKAVPDIALTKNVCTIMKAANLINFDAKETRDESVDKYSVTRHQKLKKGMVKTKKTLPSTAPVHMGPSNKEMAPSKIGSEAFKQTTSKGANCCVTGTKTGYSSKRSSSHFTFSRTALALDEEAKKEMGIVQNMHAEAVMQKDRSFPISKSLWVRRTFPQNTRQCESVNS